MATILYSGLLGIVLVILSVRVVALRGNPAFAWFKFGYGGEYALDRAVRAHGNLAEYAPTFLLMMLIAEQSGYSSFALHCYGGTFLLGRLMHGVCFGFMESNLPLRIAGTVLTLFPLLGLSVILLAQYFSS